MASTGERFSKAGAGYEWLCHYFSFTPGVLFTFGKISILNLHSSIQVFIKKQSSLKLDLRISWIASGLIVSSNFVEYACISLLVNFYGKEVEKQQHLAKVAMLVSFQEGLVSLLSIVYARLIDLHMPRRFYALLLSTASYIMVSKLIKSPCFTWTVVFKSLIKYQTCIDQK